MEKIGKFKVYRGDYYMVITRTFRYLESEVNDTERQNSDIQSEIEWLTNKDAPWRGGYDSAVFVGWLE